MLFDACAADLGLYHTFNKQSSESTVEGYCSAATSPLCHSTGDLICDTNVQSASTDKVQILLAPRPPPRRRHPPHLLLLATSSSVPLARRLTARARPGRTRPHAARPTPSGTSWTTPNRDRAVSSSPRNRSGVCAARSSTTGTVYSSHPTSHRHHRARTHRRQRRQRRHPQHVVAPYARQRRTPDLMGSAGASSTGYWGSTAAPFMRAQSATLRTSLSSKSVGIGSSAPTTLCSGATVHTQNRAPRVQRM